MYKFFEGLPGAGKSYEAMVSEIIPALKKGRQVYARLNGLDHEKIAAAAELDIEVVNDLLHELSEADMANVYEVVQNDSLVVLDEQQNFWPSGARNISEGMTKFVTEHRHRGLDIIGMGQDLRDVHNIWKRRCDQKIVFEKLTAVGKVDSYRWTAYKGVMKDAGLKFVEISKGRKEYDPKYFGTYASHRPETENTSTHVDARTNLKANKIYRIVTRVYPLIVIGALLVIGYMFWGGGLASSMGGKKETAKSGPAGTEVRVQTVKTVTTTPAPDVATTPASAPQAGPVTSARKSEGVPDDDLILSLSTKYRPRLAGVVSVRGGRSGAVVEWIDDGFHVRERMSARAIEELGWYVQPSAYSEHVFLVRADKRIVVTAWPLDAVDGKMSDKTVRDISNDKAT